MQRMLAATMQEMMVYPREEESDGPIEEGQWDDAEELPASTPSDGLVLPPEDPGEPSVEEMTVTGSSGCSIGDCSIGDWSETGMDEDQAERDGLKEVQLVEEDWDTPSVGKPAEENLMSEEANGAWPAAPASLATDGAMVGTALHPPSCEEEREVESRSVSSRGIWDVCTLIYVWLLRHVLAVAAWARRGPSDRRPVPWTDLGSPNGGPCTRHGSSNLQVSTCESCSPQREDSLGIRLPYQEKWADPRVMTMEEGQGSYETDEGGDQRNQFNSDWTLSLEMGVDQLPEDQREGGGFPHTQDWPEEERLFDVEEEFERAPDGERGCVSGKFQGTMEELVGLLGQMQAVQQALGQLHYSGAEDLLDLVGGEDWEAILGQLWMERDDALERQRPARLVEESECSAGGYASGGPLYQERFPSSELRSLM